MFSLPSLPAIYISLNLVALALCVELLLDYARANMLRSAFLLVLITANSVALFTNLINLFNSGG